MSDKQQFEVGQKVRIVALQDIGLTPRVRHTLTLYQDEGREGVITLIDADGSPTPTIRVCFNADEADRDYYWLYPSELAVVPPNTITVPLAAWEEAVKALTEIAGGQHFYSAYVQRARQALTFMRIAVEAPADEADEAPTEKLHTGAQS